MTCLRIHGDAAWPGRARVGATPLLLVALLAVSALLPTPVFGPRPGRAGTGEDPRSAPPWREAAASPVGPAMVESSAAVQGLWPAAPGGPPHLILRPAPWRRNPCSPVGLPMAGPRRRVDAVLPPGAALPRRAAQLPPPGGGGSKRGAPSQPPHPAYGCAPMATSPWPHQTPALPRPTWSSRPTGALSSIRGW